MRLHHVLSAIFLAAVVGAAGSARAEGGKDIAPGLIDAPKRIEAAPGSAAHEKKPAKLNALFSTQGQLFVEQKDAPLASKTSLRIDGAPRLSSKSKD